jgi:hypothetical protein
MPTVQHTLKEVSQMKRPCNPNHYGLDARPFLYQKALFLNAFSQFLLLDLSNNKF